MLSGFTPEIKSGTTGSIGLVGAARGGIKGGWDDMGGPTKSPSKEWLLVVDVRPDIKGWV